MSKVVEFGMQKKILITGVSGTGKSTICRKLSSLGYETYDIENINGMFEMFHKGTKKVFEDYDNSNPEHVKNSEWLCNVKKLEDLIKSQKFEIAFYCGIASNMKEILSFFDKVVVLQPDSNVLNERLTTREGTNDIGNTQEGRDVVLGWKDWWENEMYKKGAIFINANKSPEIIADEVIKTI